LKGKISRPVADFLTIGLLNSQLWGVVKVDIQELRLNALC
jgi:hypothetical protein